MLKTIVLTLLRVFWTKDNMYLKIFYYVTNFHKGWNYIISNFIGLLAWSLIFCVCVFILFIVCNINVIINIHWIFFVIAFF